MTEADDERLLTAHHEAGHAVAALLRGGGELKSMTIEPTADYAGCTWSRSKAVDRAFIVYAGPWAEARVRWNGPTLDDFDEDGLDFNDHLMTAFLRNPDDRAAYKEAGGGGDPFQHTIGQMLPSAGSADRDSLADFLRQQAAQLGIDMAHPEQVWTAELERVWPAICEVAALLVDGQAVDHDTVQAAIKRMHSGATDSA
ncbi:M50 family metallopeptidase [Mycobacterium noviomagense]|uniref:Peptidase M41 domain-containing protein n=1 Tax=Mycobacterium noviomagense TaxID=459858 RepID=A0A7I7PHM2_9MYCO|nr:M50 family metallopeptidase [Mycobacterium noviomagense]ORB16768.1 hypothetical protein BST37_05605 [Mycobacterium noviomagense]BBY08113.1 hypothetical protein MNVI_34310 [Mycobacterium noviomagense]